VCVCSGTWGDVGTTSLGELLDGRVSMGRPNLLLKKGNESCEGGAHTKLIKIFNWDNLQSFTIKLHL